MALLIGERLALRVSVKDRDRRRVAFPRLDRISKRPDLHRATARAVAGSSVNGSNLSAALSVVSGYFARSCTPAMLAALRLRRCVPYSLQRGANVVYLHSLSAHADQVAHSGF